MTTNPRRVKPEKVDNDEDGIVKRKEIARVIKRMMEENEKGLEMKKRIKQLSDAAAAALTQNGYLLRYDYDYVVGSGNFNDGSHYGREELLRREPHLYEQFSWQPPQPSYYDCNTTYDAYHSNGYDGYYHDYATQPPLFDAPYSQHNPQPP
ncbi:hypothetical protein Ahy_B08g091621 [Arachis hypogaea]|uniref:Uncharacterized protein n=1 Tax=Arachis hypogaea TaxID=3818 RepID=A0A444Y2C4_ARAHY|nr:hypothetical protein Ahy_B08g091621 [Arachis hypogaea]